jgi:hypothetical protein
MVPAHIPPIFINNAGYCQRAVSDDVSKTSVCLGKKFCSSTLTSPFLFDTKGNHLRLRRHRAINRNA